MVTSEKGPVGSAGTPARAGLRQEGVLLRTVNHWCAGARDRELVTYVENSE
jgi:hypothetical protein